LITTNRCYFDRKYKSRRIRLSGHVWRSEEVIENITKWRPNKKLPRGYTDNGGQNKLRKTSG